jgi:hypothetical protein
MNTTWLFRSSLRGGDASGYEPRSHVAGRWIRLGGRKPAEPSCQDEIAVALVAIRARTGQQVFTVREV